MLHVVFRLRRVCACATLSAELVAVWKNVRGFPAHWKSRPLSSPISPLSPGSLPSCLKRSYTRSTGPCDAEFCRSSGALPLRLDASMPYSSKTCLFRGVSSSSVLLQRLNLPSDSCPFSTPAVGGSGRVPAQVDQQKSKGTEKLIASPGELRTRGMMPNRYTRKMVWENMISSSTEVTPRHSAWGKMGRGRKTKR